VPSWAVDVDSRAQPACSSRLLRRIDYIFIQHQIGAGVGVLALIKIRAPFAKANKSLRG
jgi:hypothetical protein